MRKFILCLFSIFLSFSVFAFNGGIYINESTMQNTKKLTWLIAQSKKYGVNTFVIDVNHRSGKVYESNVKRVLDSGIIFVARIVIFPRGGTHAQIMNKDIWERKLGLAKYAIGLGANAIQLDYIRYGASKPATPEKAHNILKVVTYFKNALASYHIPLQMDIFGIAANKPAYTIGQDAGLLSAVVDVFCPMVYPSHYEPYLVHAVQPYQTVYHSISSLKKQLQNSNTKIYAFIELYNYRYPLSGNKKFEYITAEMKGAKAGGADGYYVWSPNNEYAALFQVLSR